MSKDDGWVKTDAGLFIPVDHGKKHVQRAEFAVKVKGFQPDDKRKPRPKNIELRMVAYGI